ncbi:MAG TPA: 4-hydroxythreonine-4-phosphate dehydrogenase PdxA [Bdellovibrionales bacterium]|nr:MAG: 4-hydroxythreonine-4-phosphate dehydrogenase PdxA [Bdellovibrionales bacterium GWA1_52_35]HAR44431.1 4-hydroxythreonine-4-phosphate dehydrogenase PdxA [Bdellovibrionales bacterium]HCM40703.1 4-hydroxythreonine-4-phosphate dehydrogenase PdxA [Bdellovibrionales bacterium]
MKSNRPLIIITPGDPDGIGPEIVWKTLKKRFESDRADFLCIGARKPFDALGAPVRETSFAELSSGVRPHRSGVWLLPAPKNSPRGSGLLLPGIQSGWSIDAAVKLVRSRIATALVTGPIHKERLQKGGYLFPGHTEMLAELCGVPEVTMMLANEQLRVSLVTTHIGYAAVSKALTPDRIRRTVEHTFSHLQNWWGIKKPKIAVAALNPHAGEGGLFGSEEIRVIGPTVRRLQKSFGKRCELRGPLPADTLFAKHMSDKKSCFDAVVCMYHDQGLIPVKLLDFPRTVNITLGLPIIRTSVDHGVGFDIAGKGVADPSSLQSAISLAIRLQGSLWH